MQKLVQWFRKVYNKSIHSIGFYPALIAICWLVVAIMLMRFDHSQTANMLRERYVWLSLKNAEAARTIVTTIASGILALTVFSFSMVMVVMSQAASQMSNRVIDNLIGNTFQQWALGFYIGTILYSFFLLSTIDDKATVFIPSITVFILMLLAIIDIFLFVYFLHYITESIRYEQLIKRLHNQTLVALNKYSVENSRESVPAQKLDGEEVVSPFSGYFQGFNKKQLLTFLSEHDLKVAFLIPKCSYILQGLPLFKIEGKNKNDQLIKQLIQNLDFYSGQEIDKNPFYGFLHLSEVAVKALSPGINDPGTAVLSINALADLFAYELHHHQESEIKDKKGIVRIIIPQRTFEELFTSCIYPIWDYGKKDRFIKNALERLIHQLRLLDKEKSQWKTLDEFEKVIASGD